MSTHSIKSSSRLVIMAIASIVMLTVTSITEAVTLPINTGTPPDISSFGITTDYNVTSGEFTANGVALSYLDSVSAPARNITSGTFFLVAQINSAGVMSGGSLNIGENGSSLLTGALTMFPTEKVGPGDAFEFLFDVTGGSLASVFGLTGGVVLSNPGFNGNFNSNFHNTFQSSNTAAVAPVPLPATAWLFLSGLMGMGLRSVRACRQA